MRHLPHLLLALIAAGLLIAPTAAPAWQAPGQHLADTQATQLVIQARSFWADRNVNGCQQGITAWQALDLTAGDENAWGRGDGATCELWVSDALVASLQIGSLASVDDLVDACTAVTHETGHALGLSHTPTGVMAGGESKPPWPHAWAPYFCVVWAQRRIAEQHRVDGVPETTIRKWARAARDRLLHPHPQKGVLR